MLKPTGQSAPFHGHAPPAVLAVGRYRLTTALGQGSLGAVYEAYDSTRDENVAVKVLNRADPNDIYHLKNEFRSLTELTHPNLIQLHELFADNEVWFFSMELVRGEPFDRYVRPNGVLDLSRLRRCLAQLTHAVRALHQAGKLHRDLKPSNLLVCSDGRLVVLDFGLVVDREVGAGETLSQPGICGTPSYMAPEQAAGLPACAASDVYAIGSILYEALSGRLPFHRRCRAIWRRCAWNCWRRIRNAVRTTTRCVLARWRRRTRRAVPASASVCRAATMQAGWSRETLTSARCGRRIERA